MYHQRMLRDLRRVRLGACAVVVLALGYFSWRDGTWASGGSWIALNVLLQLWIDRWNKKVQIRMWEGRMLERRRG